MVIAVYEPRFSELKRGVEKTVDNWLSFLILPLDYSIYLH